MTFYLKKFNELSNQELYEILQLRSEVFVVEQTCIYQDIDGKDYKALHLFGEKEGEIVAYTRLFKAGDYFDNTSIGRVAVKQIHRSFGYGHQIIKESINAIYNNFGISNIEISAQKYLQSFYESHGFKAFGPDYLEDGIPHIAMLLTNEGI